MTQHQYTIKRLKPKVVNDLIRIGNKKADGGYILSKRQIDASKVLVGMGINYDWTFEEEFKNKGKDVDLYCYDFSVSKGKYLTGFFESFIDFVSPNTYYRILKKEINYKEVLPRPIKELRAFFGFNSFFKKAKHNYFYKEGVSDNRSGVFITVADVMNNITNLQNLPDNSVFVKMDIEGSEYDIIEDVLKYSSKINGIIIEFHEVKQFWTEFNALMDLLLKDFEVIHVHGNNSCPYIPNTKIPMLPEISFIKRSLLSAEELNSVNNRTYPLPEVDRPNIPNKKDLEISFD